VNRFCPKESPVGLSRQEVSVSSTLEGTHLTIECGPYTAHEQTDRFQALLLELTS